MKAISKILACCLALAGASARSAGTDEGMLFLDIWRLSRAEAQQSFAFARRGEIGQVLPLRAVDRRRVSDAFEVATMRIEINAASLVPFRSGVFRLSSAAETVVRLPIANETYDLAIVDVVFHASFGVYHVAGRVLGTDDGYARFTVNLADGTVIGTVYTKGEAWRITPAEGGEGHLVRRVKQPSTGGMRNDVSTVNIAGSEAATIEARHVQMLRVAELRPLRFHTRDTGSLVSITAEEIERIDLGGILTFPASGEGSVRAHYAEEVC